MQPFVLVVCLWVPLAAATISHRGAGENNVSGEIQSIMGLESANITVNDDEFVNCFSSENFTDGMQTELLQRLSAAELMHFIQNKNLTEYHHRAVNVFLDKYGDRPINLRDSRARENPIVYENEIMFKDFKTFKECVAPFASKVKAIKMDFQYFDSSERPDILDFIEKHLAKTLKSVKIFHILGDHLQCLANISFPAVEELSFYSCYLIHDKFDLNRTFPSVRRFSATRTQFYDRMWVQNYFPHLTHLQVTVDAQNCFTEEDVLNILESNRQINSFSAFFPTSNLLRVINEQFSNIRNLGIISHQSSQGDNVVQMDHVKRFLHEDPFNGADKFIQFKELKEIQWDCTYGPASHLIHFLTNYSQQIETLRIANTVITDGDLEQMHILEKVEKVSFSFFPDNKVIQITGKSLLSFVQANKNIAEVRLIRAKKLFLESVYAAFVDAGLADWLDLSHPILEEKSNVRLKHPDKNVLWEDSLSFLGNNIY